MIAVEQTKRICYGLEIDPKYCDVIISRWEKFTGKEAQLETSLSLEGRARERVTMRTIKSKTYLQQRLKEADIQKQCLDYLKDRPGKYWRQNTGAVLLQYKGKERFIRYNQPGAADISGIRWGKRIEIEVKRPGENLTPLQKAYGEMIRKHGGTYLVVSSVEDLVREGF